MMRTGKMLATCCGVLFPVCATASIPPIGPTLEARTRDGLALRLSREGAVAGLSLDGRSLSLSSKTGGFSVTEFLPPRGEQRSLGAVRGRISAGDGGQELRTTLTEAGFDFRARFRGHDG